MAGAARVARDLRKIRKGRRSRAKKLVSTVSRRAGKLQQRLDKGAGLRRR